MQTLRRLLELIRFSHTLFALPFALLAAVMAWATPTATGEPVPFRWPVLLGILLAMTTARSAAMAFNRLVDRRYDAANPRTAGRHLPAGLLSVAGVAAFTIVSSLLFVASTLLFLPNWLPLALSLPVLAVLLGYSYAKRFTSLAHFWLGGALLLAPVSAWIAIRGEVLLAAPADLLPAAVLGAAVLCWVAGFDIIYACQDYDYDVAARLHSVPARLGVRGALRLAAALHAAMAVLLASLPLLAPQLGLGWIYAGGLVVVVLLLVAQHWLVRPDDLSRVNLAFFHLNAEVSVVLLVCGAADLLL